jgi:hypothetical protein
VGEKDFYTWLVLKVCLHKDLVQAPYFWRYHSFPEGSAFMFGRALTSVLWGMIADRYGRKPVIIFGTVSVLVFALSLFYAWLFKSSSAMFCWFKSEFFLSMYC